MRRPLRPRLSSSPGSLRIPLPSPVLSLGGDERIFRSPCPESRRVITGFLTRTLPPPSSSPSPSPPPLPPPAGYPSARTHTLRIHPLGRRKQACNIDRPRGYLFARLRDGRERGREERKRERENGKRGTVGEWRGGGRTEARGLYIKPLCNYI